MTNTPGSGGPTESGRDAASNQSLAPDSKEWRAVWLRCTEAAHMEWNKIPYNELALSGGDPRKLIVLLEKYYELADGEAWRKVDAFLRQCQPRI